MIIHHPDLTTTYNTNTKILSNYCQPQSMCNNRHLSGNFSKRIKQFCRFKFTQLLEEVPNSPLMNIMIDLLYDTFAAQTQTSPMLLTIPNAIPVELHHVMTLIWTDLIRLKPRTMGALTPRRMAADPGSLVPICNSIIDIYNRYNAEKHDQPLKTYSFSILPKPSTHSRFIALVPENIKAILLRHIPIQKIWFESLNDLYTRHVTGRMMFYGYILTDGVAINFVFSRLPLPSRLDLYAPDFNNSRDTIGRRMNTIGLDPGRRDIVPTAGGVGDAIYQNRQVSTKEYRTISEVTRRRQYLEIRKATTNITNDDGTTTTIENLESNLPTLNTTNVNEMRLSIRSHLLYLNHALAFYGIDRSRNRFKAYQGTQRTIATMANIVLNGGKKFERNRRNQAKTKQNRKHRKNETMERRRAKIRRQELIKAQYYTVNGQIFELQQQVELLDGAILNMERNNAFDTTELLETMQNQSVFRSNASTTCE